MLGVSVVAPPSTPGAFGAILRPCGVHELRGHDSGRDGDDAVPHDHHDARQGLTPRSLRNDVAEAHGRERDNTPVDPTRYAGKAVAGPLDQVHQRADDDGEDNDEQDENRDQSRRRNNRCQGIIWVGQIIMTVPI